MSDARIGVDVGGSGTKAALVDVNTGALLSERLRVATPTPSTPDAVAGAVAGLVAQLGGDGTIGLGFPAVVRDGWVSTANNIDKSWIEVDAGTLFSEAVQRDVMIINDADAAGVAELAFGAAKGVGGVVLVLTFGTGIGSALIADGRLVRNIELGQIELSAVKPAELRYSAKARKAESLEWDEWGRRANDFLRHVNEVFNPERIVVGGGVARRWEKFADQISSDLPVVRAELGTNAGIVGAAKLASTV